MTGSHVRVVTLSKHGHTFTPFTLNTVDDNCDELAVAPASRRRCNTKTTHTHTAQQVQQAPHLL